MANDSQGRTLTGAELFALQPGLARLMPEIGDRMWRLHHASEASNWGLAGYQLRHLVKLFRLGNITRPKYANDVDVYLGEMITPLREAIEREDLHGFRSAYAAAVDSANDYHVRWNKPYIVWKTSPHPPADLDLTPRSASISKEPRP